MVMKTKDVQPAEKPREKAVALPMPPPEEGTVRVRTLVGRNAGAVVDMPYSAAQNAVMSGTAERVEGEFYAADFPGLDRSRRATDQTAPTARIESSEDSTSEEGTAAKPKRKRANTTAPPLRKK
ncbi:MAG: hypothetical protein H0U85_08330 [Gemmatimonadales bacterium]|nr:hypothetical protein [Gemmatimonadales bacterium]